MSGIAGAIDLAGRRSLPDAVLQAMSNALRQRGPDGSSAFSQDGVHFVSRRLNNSAAHDQRQETLASEDGSLHVVFDGAFFSSGNDSPAANAQGRHASDESLLLRLYQDHGADFVSHLRGQFAFALLDLRRRRLFLARDRFGISPLFVTRQGDWLLFASEIKALLASGMVPRQVDRRGLNHLFTFFALPGPITCFAGVSSILPGHCLEVSSQGKGERTLLDRAYWVIDFPDRGQELDGEPEVLADRFEEVLTAAIGQRLDADIPVASYLSGGADSSLVVALARKVRGEPPPTFTVRINDPRLDETSAVGTIARRLGCQPIAVGVGRHETLTAYPHLVEAAESPVLDTACAALLLLAEEVHARGFKIALTGEGADEWMGSYPWFRVHRMLSWLDVIPGMGLSQLVRRLFLRLSGAPLFPKDVVRRSLKNVGGPNPWLDMYGLVSLSKLRFFSAEMKQVMADNNPYADLGLNMERFKAWHPFNCALALGARVHLPGLLLNAKGDRVAMRSAVQMRYPFLDENVFEFLTRLHPRWKNKGRQDKYLLRLLAARHLPSDIAWRRKVLFQAPFEGFHQENPPPFVDELFSPESLRKTGYFDVDAVLHWRRNVAALPVGSTQRTSIDMGLAGIFSTQLWHHQFIDASLAALPGPSPNIGTSTI